MKEQQRCGALTKAGRPCRAWPVRGSDPPRCSAHGGGKRPVGAPQGNRNAEKHGWYSQQRPSPDPSPDSNPSASSGFYAATPDEVTIDNAIADGGSEQSAGRSAFYPSDPSKVTIDGAIAGLVDKMARLDELIAHTPNNLDILRLFELYTQASSRLARLLRERKILSGEADDELTQAFAIAAAEIGEELGLS